MFKFLELIQAEYDDLARLLSSEHGKTFADAKGRYPARPRSGRVRLRHSASC
jgi:acyl-CoA reductase-like NAD-dependent aldehyde dehydrogenase